MTDQEMFSLAWEELSEARRRYAVQVMSKRAPMEHSVNVWLVALGQFFIACTEHAAVVREAFSAYATTDEAIQALGIEALVAATKKNLSRTAAMLEVPFGDPT